MAVNYIGQRLGLVLLAGWLCVFSTGCTKHSEGTPAPAATATSTDGEVEAEFERLGSLVPGVYQIQKDVDGKITSCVIVGQSRIVAHSPKVVAIAAAKEAARWEAITQFSEFLTTTNVSAKSGQRSRTSESTIAGTEVLSMQVNSTENLVTLVLGWKPPTKDSLGKSVKIRKEVQEDFASSSERFCERIWADEVLVVEDATILVGGDGGQGMKHYRQWYSDGRPMVDVVLLGTNSDQEISEYGWLWDETGLPYFHRSK